MTNKTKAQLTTELDELREQLNKQTQAAAAGFMSAQVGTKMVPIKNYGGTVVSVVFDVLGTERAVLLEPDGLKSVGSIPLDRWMDLERGSKLVELGYIARTDVPTDNPNVIEDIDRFIAELPEDQVVERVTQIANANVLYKLNDPLGIRDDLSGKEMLLLSTVRDRIFELTEVRVVSRDPMGD
ncbi:MAG: hypothetical protein KOO63_03865 [Bacteroidales bacterium]|nr:hypothetical protein [Candidatus Latescibacterota bacterium]